MTLKRRRSDASRRLTLWRQVVRGTGRLAAGRGKGPRLGKLAALLLGFARCWAGRMKCRAIKLMRQVRLWFKAHSWSGRCIFLWSPEIPTAVPQAHWRLLGVKNGGSLHGYPRGSGLYWRAKYNISASI